MTNKWLKSHSFCEGLIGKTNIFAVKILNQKVRYGKNVHIKERIAKNGR